MKKYTFIALVAISVFGCDMITKDVQSEVDDLKSQTQFLQDQIQSLQSEILALTNEVAQLKTEITDIQTQIVNISGQINELSAVVDSTDAELLLLIQNLEASLVELQQELDEKNQELRDLYDAKIASLESAIEDLTTELALLDATDADLLWYIEGLQDELDDLEDELTDLTTDLNALLLTVAAIQDDIDTVVVTVYGTVAASMYEAADNTLYLRNSYITEHSAVQVAFTSNSSLYAWNVNEEVWVASAFTCSDGTEMAAGYYRGISITNGLVYYKSVCEDAWNGYEVRLVISTPK
jgi:FtsZ-binding cell division protein ZapB|tara:strand:- start:124 stop:1008 length:885 start_codon:yes stop_codon:yes gene_type:complete